MVDFRASCSGRLKPFIDSGQAENDGDFTWYAQRVLELAEKCETKED